MCEASTHPDALRLPTVHELQVGDGVKGFKEDDWVIPFKPHMGTWRSLAVWKAADLLRIPSDVLSIEHAALTKQLCLAYRLLEGTKTLKVCISPSRLYGSPVRLLVCTQLYQIDRM